MEVLYDTFVITSSINQKALVDVLAHAINLLFPTNFTSINIVNRSEEERFERKESSKTATSKSKKEEILKAKFQRKNLAREVGNIMK